MISLFAFLATATAVCTDASSDPSECYISKGNCEECMYATKCAGKCISYYGFTCAAMEEIQASCPDAGNCVDTASTPEQCYVGNENCWECETAKSCALKCVMNYGIQDGYTCDDITEFGNSCQPGDIWSIGGGSGGGGGGVTIGECTRRSAGPDFYGYEIKFDAARDGAITHDGEMITVESPRATPDWCKDKSVLPPQQGETMLWSEYYHKVGLHKLACLGWTEAKHTQSTSQYGTCQEKQLNVYGYDAFAQAVGYFPDFAGFDSLELSLHDLAAFMAHSAKETTGGAPGENNAWCWVNEGGAPHSGTVFNGHYGTQGVERDCKVSAGYPAFGSQISPSDVPPEYQTFSNDKWNKEFFGRGAIQLSYCYNYHFFTNWVESQLKVPKTAKSDFYNNPGMIGTNDWAFAAGLWFYMSPSSDGNKPSMHSVVDSWSYGIVHDTVGNRPSDVGFQTNILNGGVECDPATASGMGLTFAEVRRDNLNGFLKRLDAPNADASGSYLHLPQMGTAGCSGAKSLSGEYAFMGWYVGDWECSGDSLNTCLDDPVCPWGGKPDPNATTTTSTTTTPYCPPAAMAAGMCPTNPPAQSTTTTAPTTTPTTTTAPTTTPTTTAPTTTPTTPGGPGNERCCVRSEFIDSADVCHGLTTSNSCGSNTACAWSSECVDHVHNGETTVPTEGPEMKCCTLSADIVNHEVCAGAAEESCNSWGSFGCIWTAATDCVDHVHF